MNCSTDTLRKTLAAGISLTMLTVSVAVPLVDRGQLSVELAAESGHDPARCHHAHDHTVCTQVVANVPLVLASQRHWANHSLGVGHPPVDPEPEAYESFLEGHPSRAPPPA